MRTTRPPGSSPSPTRPPSPRSSRAGGGGQLSERAGGARRGPADPRPALTRLAGGRAGRPREAPGGSETRSRRAHGPVAAPRRRLSETTAVARSSSAGFAGATDPRGEASEGGRSPPPRELSLVA